MLHIQLLGDFMLSFDGVPVTTVNTARLQSLLAYLVLHRDAPQSRRHLAFLLWPDSTEAQALTNLRKFVHQLRRALPQADDWVLADAKTVQWEPAAPFTLDVTEFQAAIGSNANGVIVTRSTGSATCSSHRLTHLHRRSCSCSSHCAWKKLNRVTRSICCSLLSVGPIK